MHSRRNLQSPHASHLDESPDQLDALTGDHRYDAQNIPRSVYDSPTPIMGERRGSSRSAAQPVAIPIEEVQYRVDYREDPLTPTPKRHPTRRSLSLSPPQPEPLKIFFRTGMRRLSLKTCAAISAYKQEPSNEGLAYGVWSSFLDRDVFPDERKNEEPIAGTNRYHVFLCNPQLAAKRPTFPLLIQGPGSVITEVVENPSDDDLEAARKTLSKRIPDYTIILYDVLVAVDALNSVEEHEIAQRRKTIIVEVKAHPLGASDEDIKDIIRAAFVQAQSQARHVFAEDSSVQHIAILLCCGTKWTFRELVPSQLPGYEFKTPDKGDPAGDYEPGTGASASSTSSYESDELPRPSFEVDPESRVHSKRPASPGSLNSPETPKRPKIDLKQFHSRSNLDPVRAPKKTPSPTTIRSSTLTATSVYRHFPSKGFLDVLDNNSVPALEAIIKLVREKHGDLFM